MTRDDIPDPATRLADDYLERLVNACRAAGVPRRRTAALVAQSSRHFTAARAANPGSEAVAVLDAIRLLGEPDEIAGSSEPIEEAYASPAPAADGGRVGRIADRARAALPGGAPATEAARSRPQQDDVELGPLDALALLGITVGWLLPGPGWLLGAVALVSSRRWIARDKLIALVVPWLVVAVPAYSMVRQLLSTDPFVMEDTTIGVVVVPALVSFVAFGAAGVFLWLRLQPKEPVAAER